jgi:putative urate catabolism protein
MSDYPRDLIGYGRDGYDPEWPDDALIAVQFVVNYEEGGESNVLHGDPASEHRFSEIVGTQPRVGRRSMSIESLFEYGSRAGFWRLWRLFDDAGVPVTVFGVATAMERNAPAVQAMLARGWEIASHGLKWIDYFDIDKDSERAQMNEAIRIHTELTGAPPLGWYTGARSEHTTDLVAENGGFVYSSDSYADDLPYWIPGPHDPLLIVPYTLDANDVRFAMTQGFNSGTQFFDYLRDSFDVLYAEGRRGRAKMMSVGLHCRISGRPGRAAALRRFIDYVTSHDRVWLPRRIDIARHWHTHHPAN